MDFAPVSRTTSAQQVAEQIMRMVRSGKMNPGDQLPAERVLIEKFAVGRSTLREALQILSTLNIVQSYPGQGTFLKAPRTDEILRSDIVGFLINSAGALELLEAREMIEPHTIRLACLRATEEDFERLEALLSRHSDALRAGLPVSEHAASFHVILAEVSHNRVAATFMRSILDLLHARGERIERTLDMKWRELEEHQEIARLLRLRDADMASEMLRQHIVSSAAIYDSGRLPAAQPTA